MKTTDYRLTDMELYRCPFNRRYFSDPWVAYHGTSSINEQQIEKNGLKWSDQNYTRSDISQVISIFEKLFWYGAVSDGLAVLLTYTQSDFDISKTKNAKPIFLAQSSMRALSYAQRSWAGGETVRALRIVFEELDRYRDDDEFRRNEIAKSYAKLKDRLYCKLPKNLDLEKSEVHEHSQIRELWDHFANYGRRYSIIPNKDGEPPVVFEKQWLVDQLNGLEHLRTKVFSMKENHLYGVIYVVRFDEHDIPSLRYSPSGALISLRPIPANKIIDKAKIYASENQVLPILTDEEWINRAHEGIYKAQI
ncbi:MAG TPA: hypothetical protein P5119_11310 [Candidatus Aminicenantes bacterium]|nr:hypothetical protein [Candidatus Aminicenantes bacterium]HRY65912.1 hypothetical protein [Candidatus Aminicenantes bacterium]HRZ72762.1 hypothetical protein [Candidatus Aminicenantes bacterium]